MSLGDEWTETTAGSSSKLNQVTLTYGTGTYLSNLDKTKHKLVLCTSTGSGFTKDHLYFANADGDTWVDISDVDSHTHYDSTDGGELIEILAVSAEVIDTGALYITEPDKAKWTTNVSGTGAVNNNEDGTTFEKNIELDTGATNASTAYIKISGLEWDSSKKSWFKILQKIDTASSLAFKVGPNIETLSGADNNNRKYGYELCTTVNNNFFAVSANGTTRSSSDTGTAMDTSRTSLSAIHYPANPKMDLYINNSLAFSKTSNIPTTYVNDLAVDKIMRISLKNNTGASRVLRVYGMRMVYTTSSKWDEQ